MYDPRANVMLLNLWGEIEPRYSIPRGNIAGTAVCKSVEVSLSYIVRLDSFFSSVCRGVLFKCCIDI